MSDSECWTKERKIDTGRICEVCEKPIYKIFAQEYNRKTGDVVNEEVCIWAQWFTCSKECYERRYKLVDKRELLLSIQFLEGTGL